MPEYVRIPSEELHRVVTKALQAHDVPSTDADIAAEVLVSADLRGVESHGVARLVPYYLTGLDLGHIKARPEPRIVSDLGAAFTLDADNGLGHPACHRAMKECISRADEYGVAVGGVRNSNHFGIAGYYAMMALDAGMIGICLTNSRPLVMPTGARESILGTNPISVAVPAGEHRPFVLDMATSVVPIGKIQVHARTDRGIPSTWGADSAGHPTDDPQRIIDGGGLFPLGGPEETSGYKGYGLAAMVDIFSGVLTGASFLSNVLSGSDPEPADVGHFVAALRIDAMIDRNQFSGRMDEFIEELKTAPRAEGYDRIWVAGEKEYDAWQRNITEGVPVHVKVLEDIIDLGVRLGMPVPPNWLETV